MTNIDGTRTVLYLVTYKFTAITILILQMRIHIISRLNHLSYRFRYIFSRLMIFKCLKCIKTSYLIRDYTKYCLNARNSRSKGVLIGLEVREFERRRAERQVFPRCQEVILAKNGVTRFWLLNDESLFCAKTKSTTKILAKILCT